MAMFDNLGRALRWLREERRVRQYQVADTASITKAMLSSYETGKQKPSLETLEKVMTALDCNLHDLASALEVFSAEGKPLPPALRPRPPLPPGIGPGGGLDVYALLDIDPPLPVEEEEALRQLLEGFHRLIRHLHEHGTAPDRGRSRSDEPDDET